jgi:hypothetical protein
VSPRRLLILIPAYNEAGSLAAVIDEVGSAPRTPTSSLSTTHLPTRRGMSSRVPAHDASGYPSAWGQGRQSEPAFVMR